MARKKTRQTELEKFIERVDAGESAWSEADTEVELEVKKPLNIVVPVRLASEQWRELYAEARELGIGPSTLMRMWTLEKLRAIKRRRRRPA